MDIDGETVLNLLYADDSVLIAESNPELQNILNTLDSWCKTNGMTVHPLKYNSVHFRL